MSELTEEQKERVRAAVDALLLGGSFYCEGWLSDLEVRAIYERWKEALVYDEEEQSDE